MNQPNGQVLSTCILPYQTWEGGARASWQRAEELGFAAAYTYDHLSWRSFRDGPWFGAWPTLTAAAGATERIRLGTLVTNPNFRHPVTLAKDLISLDDISGGRVTLGIGAGTIGFDATVLGHEPWSPRERADRFAEFVNLLDRLLTEPDVTSSGQFYSANEARNIPGCVQQPRIPFAIAAFGPRGLALTARHGQAWVSTGDPSLFETGTPAESDAAIAGQIARLEDACGAIGRDPASIRKVLLTGFTPEANAFLESTERFADYAGRHLALGFDEIVLHWPIPDSEFDAPMATFEEIATGGLG
ncbi:LLM class flavin-dependent oxidoreductase [Nocardioides marmorisolisilvae]|uniref:LLM class flavin-dependent oxidoreductase n=1 Tax=Nocardioides marmorisolisilvae TaxID=1542737 RepID=A0A3N0DVY9_9ACTN|nr:LLM class flavin-dependent oxidoreductase [Nocardioides marmorisolisilvae]RNL79777.1 LLM class flavin-dependent oxidoreductase [Nocardioides marmorisolisilvae]